MARPRLHIINTELPISNGVTLKANCGVEVRNVKAAFCWDEITVGEMISAWPQGACKQCCSLSDRQEKGRRFIYAIRSGDLDK